MTGLSSQTCLKKKKEMFTSRFDFDLVCHEVYLNIFVDKKFEGSPGNTGHRAGLAATSVYRYHQTGLNFRHSHKNVLILG